MSKISYIIAETLFIGKGVMTEGSQSNEFYTNCMRYFEALRREGKQDFGFEDEFFYTMPAISEKIISSQ